MSGVIKSLAPKYNSINNQPSMVKTTLFGLNLDELRYYVLQTGVMEAVILMRTCLVEQLCPMKQKI